MNSFLNRKYQRELLEMLAKAYPQECDISDYINALDDDGLLRYQVNMVYLEEHGLIQSGIRFSVDRRPLYGWPRINNHGLDLLADDGGLSAILGVVTIKLHEETLQDLLEQKILAAVGNPEEKTGLIAQIRSLRGESLKHLTMKLVDLGIDKTPALLHQLHILLQGLPT